MWELKGNKTVRLIDNVNGITTGWHQSHMECIADWKRQYKKLLKKVAVK